MASQQILVFKLNNENFGVNISYIDSIIKPVEIVKIPNTPSFIEGILNLRGKVYTIFNMRKRFHIPKQEITDMTKIIIVNVNSVMFGLIVDEVNQIIRIDDENIDSKIKSDTAINKKYLFGSITNGEKNVLILNLDETLSLSDEDIHEKVAKSKV